jgi:hypothetical protein
MTKRVGDEILARRDELGRPQLPIAGGSQPALIPFLHDY